MYINKISKTFILLIIWVVILLLIIMLYRFDSYLNYYGQVVEHKYIKLLIEKENINNIKNDLIINNKVRDCSIVSISDDYIIDTHNNAFYEVYYACNLEDNEQKLNYILNISIKQDKMTLYTKYLKKGLKL